MLEKIHFKEFLRLMSLLKKRKAAYWISMIVARSMFVCVQILIAFVNKNMINAAINSDMNLLLRSVAYCAAAIIMACIFDPLFRYINNVVVRYTLYDIRLMVFAHVERLPISYYENNHSGDSISRLTNDVNVLWNAYAQHIGVVIFALMYGVGSMVSMVSMDWRLSILMIILGLISTYVNINFSIPLRKISDRVQKETSSLTQMLGDILAGFRVLKMFDISEIVLKRYMTENNAVSESRLERVKKNSEMNGINYLLSTLSTAGVLIMGAFMALHGSIDFGTVVGIISLQGGVTFLFLQIGTFFAQLQESLAGAARVFELLDTEAEPERLKTDVSDDKSMISFKNVAFGYESRDKVIVGLDLSVSKGQIAALVGPSGGGKSTIIKLLMGFYTIISGGISIDGKPMGYYSLGKLRELMAYVPQDAYLFDGTIMENIKYGKPCASDEEVISAAKAAYADGFIKEMEKGYDTFVGERGARLSGGQRQRIAIARAILKNSPILLLDEATSALDSESEQMVQQALNELMKGRTVLVIAHRLSTIEKADVIYVISDGHVVEQGTHDTLMKEQGMYNHLRELQFKQEDKELAG